MARQGNYVPGAGGSVNWASGLSGSLSDLSKSLLKQANTEDENKRLVSADAENTRRFDLQQKQRDATFTAQEAERKRANDMRDYYKTISNNFSTDDIKRQKAKDIYGVTDEQLNGDKGQAILDLVPVYREEIVSAVGRDFGSKFGETLDTNRLAPYYGDTKSYAELQAAEDANTERLNKAYQFNIRYNKAFGGTSSGNPSAGSSNKGQSNKVTSWDQLRSDKYTTDFRGETWLPFDVGTSPKEDVQAAVKAMVTTLQNEGATPAEADRVLRYSLGELKTGSDLKGFDTDSDVFVAKARDTLNLIRSTSGSGGTGSLFAGYTPTNIRESNRAKTKRGIENLFAPTRSRVSGSTEQDILSNLGINTGNTTARDLPTPAVETTPSYTDDSVIGAGNVGVDIKPERQALIDRYAQGRSAVKAINDVYGKDAISTDTVFVLPYDEKGNPKPWEDVVKDINMNRDAIKFTDEVSREEFEAAKNDPAKQKEIIDRANRLIANDYRFQTATSRMIQNSGDFLDRNVLDPIASTYRDFVGGFDPTSEGYSNRLEKEKQEAKTLQTKIGALNSFDDWIAEYQDGKTNIGEGDLSNAWNAYTGFAEDSPIASNINTAAATTAALYFPGLRLAKAGANAAKPAANAVGKAVSKTKDWYKNRPKAPKNPYDDLGFVTKGKDAAVAAAKKLDGQIAAAAKNHKEITSLSDDALDKIITGSTKYSGSFTKKVENELIRRMMSKPYTGAGKGRLPDIPTSTRPQYQYNR